MELTEYGWNETWVEKFAKLAVPNWVPGRIVEESQHLYQIVCEFGVMLAEVSGKFRFQSRGRDDFPTVGDWVAVEVGPAQDRAIIHALLPRRSAFRRKIAGLELDVQVVAANVDTVFLVQAANDVNLRRLERYLIVSWESGANPVVVLTKADLVADLTSNPSDHTRLPDRIGRTASTTLAALVDRVAVAAPGVPVLPISAETRYGLSALEPYLAAGQTVALLGASGAGKSTLTNALSGEQVQRVEEVRNQDQRGRHTTTQRTLFRLPSGVMVIDTPGMRELQLWDGGTGITEAFEDIEQLATRCLFRDCQHASEPGCAVQGALVHGELDAGRYQNYKKMLREAAYLKRRSNRYTHQQELEQRLKLNKEGRKRARR